MLINQLKVLPIVGTIPNEHLTDPYFMKEKAIMETL